jgi:hypothetical protein
VTERCSMTILIFGASLRQGSLNGRLAELAAGIVETKGGSVDRATMAEFDCRPYNADVERQSGPPPGAHALQATPVRRRGNHRLTGVQRVDARPLRRTRSTGPRASARNRSTANRPC